MAGLDPGQVRPPAGVFDELKRNPVQAGAKMLPGGLRPAARQGLVLELPDALAAEPHCLSKGFQRIGWRPVEPETPADDPPAPFAVPALLQPLPEGFDERRHQGLKPVGAQPLHLHGVKAQFPSRPLRRVSAPQMAVRRSFRPLTCCFRLMSVLAGVGRRRRLPGAYRVPANNCRLRTRSVSPCSSGSYWRWAQLSSTARASRLPSASCCCFLPRKL